MQSRKTLRKLSAMSLFLSLVLFQPAFAEEKYYITETQLTTLETTLKNQSDKITDLEAQLTSAKNQQTELNQTIQEQAKSLQKSEGKNSKTKIEIGGVCFSIGVASGVVATIILINKLGS